MASNGSKFGMLMRCKVQLALLTVAFALLGGTVAADELAEFEKGRNSYSGARYEEAVQRFVEMLDPKSEEPLETPQLIEQAHIYLAASLIALGRGQEADEVIESILRNNPSAYPDPIIFPGVVLDRFTDVRGRIRQELEDRARDKARQERLRLEEEKRRQQWESERVAKLELLAEQEVHVVHNSRWVAALPFGVGQFQNQQPMTGWTLLLTEAALATTSIVTAAIILDLQSKGNEPNVDRADLNNRVRTLKTINHLSFAGFALAAVGGVTHAQITFVPTRDEIRKRELPNELRSVPSVTILPGGMALGVGGTF